MVIADSGVSSHRHVLPLSIHGCSQEQPHSNRLSLGISFFFNLSLVFYSLLENSLATVVSLDSFGPRFICIFTVISNFS